MKKPPYYRQEISRRADHLAKEEEEADDCTAAKVSTSHKCSTLMVKPQQQIIRIEPQHQERLQHWNKVQFDESFV